MKNIKFIKNIVLTTEYEGEKTDVAFNFGSIFPVTKVVVDKNGICDIYITDGTIIKGVKSNIFQIMGGWQMEQAKEAIVKTVSTEIPVEEVVITPVPLSPEIAKPKPKPKEN